MKYGKIEVRAKLPKGIGSWPAIWMLGTSRPKVGWPACGEIDIMEYVSSAPGTCHATLHWKRTDGGTNRKNASKGIKTKEPSLTDTFHVYGMEWDDKNITFTLDGKPYGTLPVDIANQPDGSNPFRAPHYLLLNLALGGSWGQSRRQRLPEAIPDRLCPHLRTEPLIPFSPYRNLNPECDRNDGKTCRRQFIQRIMNPVSI